MRLTRFSIIRSFTKLHIANLVVKPRFHFMVNYAFVKENAVKKTEIAFEMAEVVRLYESDLGINHAYIVFKFVQVVFGSHFFSQLIKAGFQRTGKYGLAKTVFDEI
jgi:hypothetical protein